MLIEAHDIDFTMLLSGAPTGPHPIAEGGLAAPEVLAMLRDCAASIRSKFSPAAWLVVEEDEIVGLCSIVEPPSTDGVVKIGYGIAASRRRRGAAQRAVAAVLDWARSDGRVSALAAETSIGNIPSQRVLERNGFARVGTRTDPEDGDLFCWSISVNCVR